MFKGLLNSQERLDPKNSPCHIHIIPIVYPYYIHIIAHAKIVVLPSKQAPSDLLSSLCGTGGLETILYL